MKLKDILKLRGTYIFCPRCGSPAVKHGRPNVDIFRNIRTEHYPLECQQCGLRGHAEENWFWEEDINV